MVVSGEILVERLRISFQQTLRVTGDAILAWNGESAFPDTPPATRDIPTFFELHTGQQSVFDHYAECQANSGEPISARSPDLAEYWKDANALLWVWADDALFIRIQAPPDPAFQPFIISTALTDHALHVRLPLMAFAGRDDALAPSVEGFLHRKEPQFVDIDCQFTPIGRADVEAVRSRLLSPFP